MKFALILLFGVSLTLGEDSVLKEFAENNRHYIGNLYKELVKVHSGNFLICPLSIQNLFALISGGARGNTRNQIISTFHLPGTDEKIKETYLRLGENFKSHNKYTSSIANKIYVAKNFNISEQYKTNAKQVFYSEIENIDFAKTQQAISEINEWVEDKTHNKIKDLVNDDLVDASTVAVFVNALFFQGKWVKQFSELTRLPFYTNKNKLIFTNLMKIAETFNYYESKELKSKFLELPYEGDDVSMTIILPNDVEGLPALEARISDVLAPPPYTSEELEVLIPKFKIETTTDLQSILESLGITDAFSGDADFSGIGENHEPLSISAVVQKSFIEVDEKGTTAAAATVLTMSRSGRDDEPSFVADHPFLFYLKHKVYGIFFVGRYSVPQKVNTQWFDAKIKEEKLSD